ncbi:energy transducer TonB [Sphingomonas koreensis]|nr:energy transducer TonB [Sphingomonas koreensis]
MSALLFAAQAATATPPKPINPQAWMQGTPYPADAKAKYQQGQVGFSLAVDKAGRVTACRITASSGAPSLDQATCAAVTANARFQPARDASGREVAGSFASTSNWRLGPANDKPIDLSKGAVRVPVVAVRVALAADGKVTGCTAVKKARPEANPCQAFSNGRQLTAPLTKGGKPVTGTYTLSDTIEIAPN